MRYGGDHKEKTRIRLLTEAASLLREVGPDGLSVVALMKRQRLTHGGFYAHFDSKEDLIHHAIDTMFDKTCERFVMRTRGLAPHQALLDYIDYYLSPSHVNRPGQGCPIPATAGDVARMGPSARKRFEAGVERLQGLMAAQFHKMGIDPADSDAEAVMLTAELSGAVIMARAIKDPSVRKHICQTARLAILRRLGGQFSEFSIIQLPSGNEDRAPEGAPGLEEPSMALPTQ